MTKFNELYNRIINETSQWIPSLFFLYKDYEIEIYSDRDYIEYKWYIYNRWTSEKAGESDKIFDNQPDAKKDAIKYIEEKIYKKELINEVSDAELFGNEVVNSILKIYKFSNGNFNDVDTEIVNFKFVEPINDRLTEIDDYKVDETKVSEELDLRKIIVFDKNTNKILFDEIFYAKDIPIILYLIDYVKLKETADNESEHDDEKCPDCDIFLINDGECPSCGKYF